MITFKAGVMPGKINEYTAEGNVTVAQALDIAELQATGYEVRVNGATASLDSTVTDNAIVLLVKQIKGNAGVLNFKAGVMPGRISEFVADGGTTIEQALAIAELNPSGYEVRVNGMTGSLTAPLSDNAIILLVKQIKGNR